MVNVAALLKKIETRPDQLQLFRYHDNGQRKIVMVTEEEWVYIVRLIDKDQDRELRD